VTRGCREVGLGPITNPHRTKVTRSTPPPTSAVRGWPHW